MMIDENKRMKLIIKNYLVSILVLFAWKSEFFGNFLSENLTFFFCNFLSEQKI